MNRIEYCLPCDTGSVQQLMSRSDDWLCTLQFSSYCL